MRKIPALGIAVTILSALLMIVVSVMFAGLKVIHPNEAAVYTLFGKYYGTIKEAGFIISIRFLYVIILP